MGDDVERWWSAMIVMVCVQLDQHEADHHTLQQPEGDAAAISADVKAWQHGQLIQLKAVVFS